MTASSTSPARLSTSRRSFGAGRISAAARRRLRLGALAAGTALLLGACSHPINVHGNIPDQEVLTQVQPGVHSRDDVMAILGSPSTMSTFQDDKWYYVGARMQQRAFLNPEELERSVFIVEFDQNGRVAETSQLDMEDGQEVAFVERETPTEGQEMTVLQQLFGNLGRFVGDGEGPVARTPSPTR